MQLYLYKYQGIGNISLGSYSADKGQHIGYGVQCTRMLNQMTQIKLYNVIAGDGSNTVYCSVDGNAGVAMSSLFHDKHIQSTKDPAGLSGKDFVFNYLGCQGNPWNYDLQMKMEY